MVNLFIRKSFNANTLKKEINKSLGTKITALKKDPVLADRIAREWAEAVNRFVPRSQIKNPSLHHLQDYSISDGRVVWSRRARRDDPTTGIERGEELAHLLYEGPIRGQFRSRIAGDTEYGTHEPQPHWDQCVQPGTEDWDEFVLRVTPVIMRYMKNNG